MQSEGVLAKYGPVSFVSDAHDAPPVKAHPTEFAERDTWDPAPQIRTPEQQLRFDLVRCQSARRRNRVENAATGGCVGAMSGLFVGIAGGLALAGPSSGWSAVGGVFGGPVVGGVVGAGVGFWMPMHLNAGLCSSVRLHFLKKIGVVATARESERIVKALQKGHVLSEDRSRFIVNWDKLDAALRPLNLAPDVRARVEEALIFIRDEGPLYDTLVAARGMLSSCMQDVTARPTHTAKEMDQRQTCARLHQQVQEALSKFGDGPVPHAERLVSEITLILTEMQGVTLSRGGPIIHVSAPPAPAPTLDPEPVDPAATLEDSELPPPAHIEPPAGLDDSALVELRPAPARRVPVSA